MILSLGVIFGSLIVGYLTQRLFDDPQSPKTLARRLQRLYVLTINPVILANAFWAFQAPTAGILSMPILGAFALFFGGGIALLAARRLRLPGPQAGSLFVCGMFSNLGSIGSLVCFLFFGETGFALAQLYRLFEHIIYYAFGFPCSNLIGKEGRIRFAGFFHETLKNPLTYVPFAAILTGFALQFLGIRRPEVLGSINGVLIPCSAGFLMFAIGLTLRLRNAMAHPRLVAAVAGIKFVLVPLVVGAFGYALGYGGVVEGVPMKVTLIQASTPVAFMAMVPSTLFDLDEEVTQACWMTSNALMLALIPLFYLTLAS